MNRPWICCSILVWFLIWTGDVEAFPAAPFTIEWQGTIESIEFDREALDILDVRPGDAVAGLIEVGNAVSPEENPLPADVFHGSASVIFQKQAATITVGVFAAVSGGEGLITTHVGDFDFDFLTFEFDESSTASALLPLTWGGTSLGALDLGIMTLGGTMASAQVVPDPGTVLLIGFGLVVLGSKRRRIL